MGFDSRLTITHEEKKLRDQRDLFLQNTYKTTNEVEESRLNKSEDNDNYGDEEAKREEEFLERGEGNYYICQQHNKASQTCFCAQNKLNNNIIGTTTASNGQFIDYNAPDSSGRLDDLTEEEEEEDGEEDIERINVRTNISPREKMYDRGQQYNLLQTKQKQQSAPPLPPPNSLENQIYVLRDLLRIERETCDKRAKNNVAMQQYIHQLQIDYLRQQSELVESLELANKLKVQKDSQLAIVEATLIEKDRLIEQLRLQLNDLDETKLRAHFKETLDKQAQLACVQEEQLKMQIKQLEQLVSNEKDLNNQLNEQFQVKLNNQIKFHEHEVSSMQTRIGLLQNQLDKYLNEPQNLIIKSLKDENSKLNNQLNDTKSLFDDLNLKYENIKRKLNCLHSEQEQNEQSNQDAVTKLQQINLEQRQLNNELRMELDDKQEVVQVLQFNLQRSEKRCRSLIGLLKNKEETYGQLVEQIELKHNEEFEKIKSELNSMQKQLNENKSEIIRKQNELIKLKLEHDNQLESMQNDRDERLNKCLLEKQKLEKLLQSNEMQLASELELVSYKTKQINQLQKDVEQFKEESKRLLIELTKSEAKLYAKQKEFNELAEKQRNLFTCDAATVSNAELLQKLQCELEEERRISKRYKNQLDSMKKDHEKICVKLRIAETNLIKMTSSINREHAKMLRDYEKKIDQLRYKATGQSTPSSNVKNSHVIKL